MTIGRYGLGAVLAIALLGLSAVPAIAAPLAVDVYAKPGDAAAAVEITVPPEATTASVPVQIFLGRRLPARRDPRFALSPLTVREPAAARLPSAPSIAMVVGGRDVTTGGFHPATRGTWAAELKVAGIDTFGTFEGDVLAAIGGGTLSTRVHLVIRRYPAAELRLGGLTGGVREVISSTPAVDVPLEIRGMNIGTAKAVSLDVGALRTADGIGAAVEVVDDRIPSTLEGVATARRTVRVTMPEPGRYEGSVTLSWNGGDLEVPLRVEWLIPPLEVSVLAAQGTTGEVPMCVELAGRVIGPCAVDAVWLVVQETGGRAVTIDAPTLGSLVRRDAARELPASAVEMTATLDCVGTVADEGPDEASSTTASTNVLTAPVAVAAAQTCGRATYDPTAQRLTLGPGAIARLRLRFAGDLGPGEYVARLAVAGESSTAATAGTSLFLRLPALWALAVFLVGCLLALPFRRLLTTARRRARRRARIATIGRRVEASLRRAIDAEARGVAEAVRVMTEDVLDGIRTGRHRGARADRWLLDLELRADGLERWTRLWTDSAALPGALQDRVRSRLVTIGRTLVQAEPLSTVDRQTLDDIDTLGELATISAARTSSVRDPRSRRPDEPGPADAWRRGVAIATGWLRWGTRIETLVLVVVTTIAGVAFVWAPNPTWGSSADVVVALLWSVALVTVATAALTGLAGLRSQLGRSESG